MMEEYGKSQDTLQTIDGYKSVHGYTHFCKVQQKIDHSQEEAIYYDCGYQTYRAHSKSIMRAILSKSSPILDLSAT